MWSNHRILCCPLLLPSIFPSFRVFSNESVLHIRWPKYWSFSFSISPSNEYSGFPLGWTGFISLLSKGLSKVFSNTTVQKHQFFGAQPFFMVQLWHPSRWSMLERWTTLLSGCLTSWPKTQKHRLNVVFSYSMHQQWTISPSDCDVPQKVDFIQQTATTS